MANDVEIIYPWWFDAASICVRYFIIAGIAYFIFYIWKREKFFVMKIQKKFPAPDIIKKEIFYSVITLIIYCATSSLVYYFYKYGTTKIYLDIDQYGYTYFSVSIFIMIIVHDAYFYWTHRLMHVPAIFKLMHKTHHLSHNPTPWSAFSFHPLEAIVSIGIIPIIIFLIPVHPFALFAFITIMIIINVAGHLGYETFPQKFIESRLGKWQNTSTNHNIHHEQFKFNYGLYFTFWDRLMNTYNPQKSSDNGKASSPMQKCNSFEIYD